MSILKKINKQTTAFCNLLRANKNKKGRENATTAEAYKGEAQKKNAPVTKYPKQKKQKCKYRRKKLQKYNKVTEVE